MRKRRAFAAASAAAIAAVGGLAFAANPTSATSDGLGCPANTKAMHSIADYDASQPVDGFDTPEAALENLRATAYPGMPPGQFRRVATRPDGVVLRGERVVSLVTELDVRHRPSANAPVVVEENGNEWVVQTFSICERDAARWGR